MRSEVIKKKERSGFIVVLMKNSFSNNQSNYSVITYLKKGMLELSRGVFDTLRRAENKYKKENKGI